MVYSKCSINVNDYYDDLGATFKRNKSNVYKSHLVRSSWWAALLITDPTLLSDFLQDSLVADFFWNTHLGISIFASSSDSPLRTPKHPVPFRPLQSIVQVLKVCDVKNVIPEQSTLLRIFSPITGFSAIFQIYLKCSWNWYVLYACSLVLIYWSIYGWNMVTWVCFKIIGKGAS